MNYLGLMTPSRTILSLISFCMLLIFSMACLTEDESKNIKHDTDESRDVFVLGDKPDSERNLAVLPTPNTNEQAVKQIAPTPSLREVDSNDSADIEIDAGDAYESDGYDEPPDMEEEEQENYEDWAEIDESEGWQELVHDPSAFFYFDDRLIGYFSGSNGDA